jgi:hypothetical protein
MNMTEYAIYDSIMNAMPVAAVPPGEQQECLFSMHIVLATVRWLSCSTLVRGP